MTQTLVSSTVTLCPVSEFLKRIDRQAVATLASDVKGVPVPDNMLATDPNVLAALIDATGLFESAVMMGAKYYAADLALMAATTCAAQGMMFRIITDLAFQFLFERRPNMNAAMPPSMNRTLEWMDMLAEGKRIFAFAEVQNATFMTGEIASKETVTERDGSVAQAAAYFGKRSDEASPGGWR